MSDDSIALVERVPDIEDDRRLRCVAGFWPKDADAAQRGLANTL